ncbi:hypothetical protein DY000_02061414 [Brassica cretica]|uniref:Uncharacterized protein n=1 Tax=Brassica cretica TaxID=69181 RepID=A0ABQ7AXM0_BRACR|nr:hypothetical protein DY000_02061414 [Brassica cretica]
MIEKVRFGFGSVSSEGTVAESDLDSGTVPTVGEVEFGCSKSIGMVSEEVVVVSSFFSAIEAIVTEGEEFLRDPLREQDKTVLGVASAKDGKLTGDRGEVGSGGSGGRMGGGSPGANTGGFMSEEAPGTC